MSPPRPALPKSGTDWDSLRARMRALGEGDADWRSARTAVYIFNAGEDVLSVAKEAYAMYQSENGLGPLAFPSLKRMEEEVVGIGLGLLGGPEGRVRKPHLGRKRKHLDGGQDLPGPGRRRRAQRRGSPGGGPGFGPPGLRQSLPLPGP